MKNFSLLSLLTTGLMLAGCEGNQPQFTQLSELEDPPFSEALESRVEEMAVDSKIGRKKSLSTDSGQIGQNGFKTDEATGGGSAEAAPETTQVAETGGDGISADVTITIEARSGNIGGKDCVCKQAKAGGRAGKRGRRGNRNAEKRDIHFYIGIAPDHCLNQFAQNTYKNGFLSHLSDLKWWFSHSVFSNGENSPGWLENDGRYLKDPHRLHKRQWSGVAVLHRKIQFYEDIFAYTVSPWVKGGIYTTHSHPVNHRDSTITYDAPQWTAANRDGEKNPLAGLDDLLTEGHGVLRPGVFADIFIISDQFPTYTPEEISAFLGTHANLRIHNLIPSKTLFKKTDLGSLKDLVEKTKGTSNQLCGANNENIGPKLAEIVADRNWTQKQKSKPSAREAQSQCGC